jgi:adenosylcobyric acid synthase
MGWFNGASGLPAEDSAALSAKRNSVSGGGAADIIKISVLSLSRISNFDDFDPLAAEDDVSLSFVGPGEAIPGDADLIIIPGTKSTIADLEYIRQQGWDIDLIAHVRRGGKILGICGGYQILGTSIFDPDAVESRAPSAAKGLGLLDVSTVMGPRKELRRFRSLASDGTEVSGYEIHSGRTTGTERPMLLLDGVPEGAMSVDGTIRGCYIHGLFTSDSYRSKFLSELRDGRASAGLRYEAEIDRILDELASRVEEELDIAAIIEITGLKAAGSGMPASLDGK